MTTPDADRPERKIVHLFEMTKEEMEREWTQMMGRSEEACRRSLDRVSNSRSLMARDHIGFRD